MLRIPAGPTLRCDIGTWYPAAVVQKRVNIAPPRLRAQTAATLVEHNALQLSADWAAASAAIRLARAGLLVHLMHHAVEPVCN